MSTGRNEGNREPVEGLDKIRQVRVWRSLLGIRKEIAQFRGSTASRMKLHAEMTLTFIEISEVAQEASSDMMAAIPGLKSLIGRLSNPLMEGLSYYHDEIISTANELEGNRLDPATGLSFSRTYFGQNEHMFTPDVLPMQHIADRTGVAVSWVALNHADEVLERFVVEPVTSVVPEES